MAVFHAIVSSQKEEPDAFIDTTSAFAHKLVAYAALGLAGVRGLRGGGGGVANVVQAIFIVSVPFPFAGSWELVAQLCRSSERLLRFFRRLLSHSLRWIEP